MSLPSSRSDTLADDLETTLENDLMTRTALVRRLGAFALAAGLAGDLLLRDREPGLNLAVYLLLVIAGTVLVVRYLHGALPQASRWLFVVAAVFATLVAVRNSEMLTFWNAVSALAATALAGAVAAPGPLGMLSRARLRDVLAPLAALVPRAFFEPVLFLLRDAWQVMPGSARRLYASRLVLRSLVIATVIVIAFGALLSAGDPVFARTTAWALDFDAGSIAVHLMAIVLFAWPVLGFLRAQLAPLVVTPRFDAAARVLSRMDALAALAGLNLVFGGFLVVQLNVLFGGMAYVRATTGLTLAEYARGGFFVLTATAALVIGLLLVLDGTLRDESLGARASLRWLSTTLLALTGVVLASALSRMWLYVDAFGLSVDRLYASVAMFWIAFLGAWFTATVLRERARRFALGAVVSTFATVLTLDAINPDALVVRANLARARAGATFDLEYAATTLGADATPELVAAAATDSALWSRFTVTDPRTSRCAVVSALTARAASANQGPSWTLAGARAESALETHGPALRRLACENATPSEVGR
jgi:hypothetical protein